MGRDSTNEYHLCAHQQRRQGNNYKGSFQTSLTPSVFVKVLVKYRRHPSCPCRKKAYKPPCAQFLTEENIQHAVHNKQTGGLYRQLDTPHIRVTKDKECNTHGEWQ